MSSFRGTKRFELIRMLGEGGMGLVYEAHDRERDMRVALKTLRDIDASSLYRFKREFRALTDISHPNIVGFYELVSEGNDWFFTMELIEGTDFVHWVRPAGWLSSSEMAIAQTSERTAVIQARQDLAATNGTTFEPAPEVKPKIEAVVQLERLRGCLKQLAQALCALHDAGMVHRDLKPSNVVVTPNGRLVLMDFGIAAEASVLGDVDAGVSGTPAFMSPEQASGDPPTASADWYSFGVMLYLALTGKLPFSGTPEIVLMSKQTSQPKPPSDLVENPPEDLEALCRALLSHDPSLRPTGLEVLARLGVVDGGFRTESPESSRAVFVGRERELGQLKDAFEAARAGRTVGAFIRGSSGMGKSTLVRRFLHEVEIDPEQPIILKGRCHERESLPYKAFDGVIDSLSHVLLRLPAERAQAMLPDEVDLLPRLFPVLRRVPGIQRARPLGESNPQEVRTRAFAALSELLRRMAAFRPLVMYIDDLQWADRDSLQLFVELLRDPDAPHMLILTAMRAENLATEPALADALRAVATRHQTCEIELQPLSSQEQRTLVSRLLGEAATPEQVSDQFWGESAGSPLFLSELVRFSRERGAVPEGERLTLEDVLYFRIERLPPPARALLETVAIAGEPLPLWVLGDASALGADERERALGVLRVTSLVRVARHGREPWLATYHDRVRETLSMRLPEERRAQLHRQLVEVLERWDEVTVDALARHWLAAGDRAQAGAYLIKAARGAAEKLAFDRAAELYRVALDSIEIEPRERRQLMRERSDALSLAGRNFEAARGYQEAAKDAQPDEATDLRRRAADNLLRAGYVEEGLSVMQGVMRALGVKVAPTRNRALMSLLLARMRLGLRGLKYQKRTMAEVSARELARVDSLYAAATALGMIDHVRGADVQSRHLLAALDLGEEQAVTRALAIETVFRASFGGRHMRAAEVIARDVAVKAAQIGDPGLIGQSHLAQGATAFFSGRYRPASMAFSEAERWFQKTVGVQWERFTARFFFVTCRNLMGDFVESNRATVKFVEEAERRNDIYTRTLFKTQPMVWRLLCEDDPDAAMRELDGALDGWPANSFYLAHYMVLVARAIVMNYRGETRVSLDEMKRGLPYVKEAQLARLPWVVSDLRRHMMHAAFIERDDATFALTLRQLAALAAPTAEAFVALYGGAAAQRAGDGDRARSELMRALQLYEEVEMSQMAAATRIRLGRLIGGSEGERMAAEGSGWLTAQGVKNPERMIDLLAPRLK